MSSYRMLRRPVLVRVEVSEEHIASIISVTRIVELGTKLAVTSNKSTLRRNIFITFQKVAFFIATAVKTPKLTLH
jgi:hypothetical protein